MSGIPMIGMVVLIGGPRCGFAGGSKVPLETKDGKTLVCLAQRGECRYNSRHYESGMSSEREWSLPQIEPNCDRRCPDRQEVADTKVDTEYTTRVRQWDPYGYSHYKRPSDVCQYQPAEGEYYSHDAKKCPQCSQPKVEPTDDWVDVVLVEQWDERGKMMRKHNHEMGGVPKRYDPIEELSATPATKAAIRTQIAKSSVSDNK